MSLKNGASPQRHRHAHNLKQWATFLGKCLRERTSLDRFQQLAKLLDARARAPSREISDALLQTQRRGAAGSGFDPLVASYAGRLLSLGLVQAHELLSALLACSTVSNKGSDAADAADAAEQPTGKEASAGHAVPWELEEALLGLVATRYATQELPRTGSEAGKALAAAAGWMSALVEADNRAMMRDMAGFQALGADVAALREAVGRVVFSLAEHPRVVQVLGAGGGLPSETAKKLAGTISAFIPLLSSVSMPLANRLDLFQRSHDVLQQRETQGFIGSATNPVDVGELQLGNIVDRPVARSRASMVVYLEALLSDLPKMNDGVLLAYLQLRFKGDSDSSTVELIANAFELLAMASARGDLPNKLFLYRTFIVNKLPILMSNLARMAFMAPNFTLLISQVFGRLHSNGFPAYELGFSMAPNSSILTDTKRDFLVACAVHGHIGKENIKSFIGDDPAPQLPTSGKLSKESLIADYSSNPQKLGRIVNGLETMDGNAGSSAEAVAQILHNLCSAKDTMGLKSLCHLLSPKPHAIDTLFLFRNSVSLLSPLCQVLDEWKYDDDQGEYQPVYEEFSSCLLFLLACIHRFELGSNDIGVPSEHGFVAWVMDESLFAQPIKDLNQEQTKQLAGWAKGLFELEGISDDVMSICPPQDFYKLVPTIFTQSILSRRLEAISLKALENGIELLLEIFLLPCMVFGTQCLANQAWTRSGGLTALLQFIHKFIRPSSKAGEALALHNTVLSILKQGLQDVLAELRLKEPSKQQEIDSLLEKLKPHSDYTRSPHTPFKDPGVLVSGPGSNVLFEFRNTFDALCSWSMPAGMMTSIPNYSHQQALLTVEFGGATRVIRTLIESLVAHAEAGVADVALDIATSIVCALEAVNYSANAARSTVSLTIRQVLQLARDDAAATVSKEPLKAEMTVLLHRQVETQLSSLPVEDMQHNMNMQSMPMDISDMPASMNMDMDMQQPMNLDMNSTNMNVDMGMSMEDMGMNMMGMDSLGMDQGAAAAAATVAAQNDMGLAQTTQAMDFAAPDTSSGLADGSATETAFPLAIDTSFGGHDQQDQGDENNDDDETGRRASVEDIWSGLGLDF